MAYGYLHKRGRVYYARYQDQSGRERWRSLRTNSKEIAHAKLAQLIEALEKEEVGWRLRGKPVVDYQNEYLALCETEHSKRTYRLEKQVLNVFLKFVGVQFLHQITADRVEAFKVKRAKKVSKGTVNRELGIVKAFLNRAVALRYLDRNPAEFVKRLKLEERQPRYLSDSEVKKLLEACSPKFRQIVMVFLLTGMRLGELCHLRWVDVDFRHKQIIIQNRPDWTTKNYKPRVVPIHPTVEQIFNSLPRNYDYVFPTREGKPIESFIAEEIGRYAKKAGIKASVKVFRSTFASNLVMSGVDVFTVSKLLGHHDVKMTEKHYAHLTPDFLTQSVARLNFPSERLVDFSIN